MSPGPEQQQACERERQRLAAALSALYARVPLGMRLGLDPMRDACARAGHPERAFEVVHIGGTNGKGSTCAMVASMARAAGKRVGLYTSPHLVRFAERIRVDLEPIDDVLLTEVLEEALAIGADLSFFETATLAAFLAFRRKQVELAVIEVGIGGRLDATNVIPRPRCTAITGVAFDHQDKLGDTLDAIAREKAAIAKPGVPMVLGPMPEEARRAVIEVATASAQGAGTATATATATHASVGAGAGAGAGAPIVEAGALPAGLTVGLAGAHQRDNARVAWTVGAELGVDEEVRARGLAEARWPGRLERIEVREGELAGTWLLDGAHNPDGARALVAALAQEPVGAVVFGALADKAWREMLGVVAEVDAPRVYVAPKGRAPAEPDVLAAFRAGMGAAGVGEALATARRAAGAKVAVVCGSLYLVGEARGLLLGIPTDPIVAL